jgi:hypothetical protein
MHYNFTMALSLGRAARGKNLQTKAASPVIRNEWDVCLALQEFQLKQLILDDFHRRECRGRFILYSPTNSLFYFKSRHSLSQLNALVFCGAAAPPKHAVWRHFAQGIAPRDERSLTRSFKHYCRANFPLQ